MRPPSSWRCPYNVVLDNEMEAEVYWVELFDQATGIRFCYLEPNEILTDESSFEQGFLFKK